MFERKKAEKQNTSVDIVDCLVLKRVRNSSSFNELKFCHRFF